MNVDFAEDLQIFKKFNMSQMNPKEVFHNTAYSVQLPYIPGHSLKKNFWSSMNWNFMFSFLKIAHFVCGFPTKDKSLELNTFLIKKNYIIFHIYDQIKVTWNLAYSPLNDNNSNKTGLNVGVGWMRPL